eukprot:2329537-Pyramimonas_sp.AAC.1
MQTPISNVAINLKIGRVRANLRPISEISTPWTWEGRWVNDGGSWRPGDGCWRGKTERENDDVDAVSVKGFNCGGLGHPAMDCRKSR